MDLAEVKGEDALFLTNHRPLVSNCPVNFGPLCPVKYPRND